jgi:hypothetical protein
MKAVAIWLEEVTVENLSDPLAQYWRRCNRRCAERAAKQGEAGSAKSPRTAEPAA